MATDTVITATGAAPSQRVQPKLASFALKESHKYSFTCDVELDLTDPDLSATFKLPDVPIRGKWTCEVRRVGDAVRFSVMYGPLPVGAFGLSHCRLGMSAVLIKGERCFSDTFSPSVWNPQGSDDDFNLTFFGFCGEITPAALAKVQSNATVAYDSSTHRHYRVVFDLEPESAIPSTEAEALVKRLPGKIFLSRTTVPS